MTSEVEGHPLDAVIELGVKLTVFAALFTFWLWVVTHV